MSFDPESLREGLNPFPQEPGDFSSYLEFYGLDFPGVQWQGGLVQDQLFLQTFRPPEPQKSWVFLIHGYLEHGALNARGVDFFLRRGHSVAVMDLPGHGLSAGERAWIDDFDTYGDALQAVALTLLETYGIREIIGCGHSTGAASLMNWQIRYRPEMLRSLIFLAPLVRTVSWPLVEFSAPMLASMVKKVSTKLGPPATSNRDFAKLLTKEDPMRIQFTHLDWVQAVRNWVPRFLALPRPQWQVPTLVCQGDQDLVVDGKFNTKILEEMGSRTQVQWFKGLKHTLFNEPGKAVYQAIKAFLLQEAV